MTVPGRTNRRLRQWLVAIVTLGLSMVSPSTAWASGLATSSPPSAASVLILDSTVSGGTDSEEAADVRAIGLNPVLVSPATWQSMSTAQFATYAALILGDSKCGSLADVAAAASNTAAWQPAVTGNVIVNGTDPVHHSAQGGSQVTSSGIAFAVGQPAHTGLYVSLSCYYAGVAAKTPIPLLNGLSSQGAFTATGVGCYDNVHLVAANPALAGMTDASLSHWNCSVHEAFDGWPLDFTVLAIARDFGGSYTASDGVVGTPYMIARGAGLITPGLSTDVTAQSVQVGHAAALVAHLADGSTHAPVSGASLRLRTLSGPDAGRVWACTPASCLSGADGSVRFSLLGTAAGLDTLQIWEDTNGNSAPDPGEPQTSASVTWVLGAYVANHDYLFRHTIGQRVSASLPLLTGSSGDGLHLTSVSKSSGNLSVSDVDAAIGGVHLGTKTAFGRVALVYTAEDSKGEIATGKVTVVLEECTPLLVRFALRPEPLATGNKEPAASVHESVTACYDGIRTEFVHPRTTAHLTAAQTKARLHLNREGLGLSITTVAAQNGQATGLVASVADDLCLQLLTGKARGGQTHARLTAALDPIVGSDAARFANVLAARAKAARVHRACVEVYSVAATFSVTRTGNVKVRTSIAGSTRVPLEEAVRGLRATLLPGHTDARHSAVTTAVWSRGSKSAKWSQHSARSGRLVLAG